MRFILVSICSTILYPSRKQTATWNRLSVMPTEDSVFVLSSHEGEEFIMVMEGVMEISYGKHTYLLEEGDSIYYDSIVPHHVHAYEGQAAKILAVVYTPV